MGKSATPKLLPLLRSRQQGEILTRLLGDPEIEASVTDIAAMLDVPISSVHREIERAQAAGIVTSRKIGNVRLVRANTESPYYRGLADVLTRAFGPPQVLAEVLEAVDGIEAAYIYGSWAARWTEDEGNRPVADIDVLVLGSPERDLLYAALSAAEERLGRPVQEAVRPAAWIANGTGSFHATVVSQPLVQIDLGQD
ncbi:ArsR family transcriptional regulator [Candidatus Poriferisodalis sp.]|uniref:ArsR family transcriptional regulator n=1 Tax=Candidatus Poriferisodalis sp. TaxID=3101277 RepID=UPI003B5BF0B2